MSNLADIIKKLQNDYNDKYKYVDDLCIHLLSLNKEKFIETLDIILNKVEENKTIEERKEFILNNFTSSLGLRFYHLEKEKVQHYADIFKEAFPIKYFVFYTWKIGMKDEAEELINNYKLELTMNDYYSYFSRFNPNLVLPKAINISAGPSLNLDSNNDKKFEAMLLKIKLERDLQNKKESSKVKI